MAKKGKQCIQSIVFIIMPMLLEHTVSFRIFGPNSNIVEGVLLSHNVSNSRMSSGCLRIQVRSDTT